VEASGFFTDNLADFSFLKIRWIMIALEPDPSAVKKKSKVKSPGYYRD
jgi:hypothetical protein